jgi:hypothetical protein
MQPPAIWAVCPYDHPLRIEGGLYVKSGNGATVVVFKEENMSNTDNVKYARLIVDRFEGDYAVCECEGKAEPVILPKGRIDGQAREGSIIIYDDSSGLYKYDAAATAERTAYIKALAKKIWQ